MREAPVLLLGFNRPDKTSRLISALRSCAPSHIIFNVDGPRRGIQSDVEAVKAVQSCTSLIDWPCAIETRFHSQNLGLRAAVVDAVSYTTSLHGRVIVIEDDAVPGPDLLTFLNWSLGTYEDREDIGHISGYNVAPHEVQQRQDAVSRLSLYPESFAWATWERAWQHYDDSLKWGCECDLSELAAVVGSMTSALRWRLNFRDAHACRIDSWAYRWIASLWRERMLCISPNVNLTSYAGFDSGTHARRRARWTDLPIGDVGNLHAVGNQIRRDALADKWIGKSVFRESVLGIADGAVTSIALECLRRQRLWRNA